MLRATILLLCIVSALAAQRAAPRSRNTARNTARAPARPRAAPARVAPRRTSPPPPPVQSRRDDPRNYDADGHYVHSFASLNPGTFYKIIVENNVTLFRYTRGNEPGVRKAQVLAQGVETAPTALSVQAIRRAPARGAPARRTTTKRTRAAPTTRPGRGRRGAVEATLRRAAGVSSTTTTTTTATVSNAENSTPTPDAPPVAQQPPVPPTVDPAAPPAPHFHPGEFAQFPGGDRKVIAFQVSFDGDGCGTEQAPAPCKPDQCSNSVITELINGSGKSVASFYNTVSRGLIRMKLNDADIFPVTIAAGTKFLDIPSEVERVLGNKEADHLVFFLPQDYKRGNFADAKTGAVGLFGAKATWMRQCVLTFLIHEIGHNLALSHSGGDSGGVFKEYYDVSSIMSLSGETGWNVGPYRGLGSNQLWHLSLLPASGILDITRDGQYTIPASLSSNGGVRAARIFTSSKGAPLWVEWREAANQDVDLGANADRLEDALRVDGDGGNFLGSLLVKELLQSRKSRLVVVIPKNAQATARGVTISHGATTGVFTVSGIGSPEAEAAALAAQRYARLKTDVMRADFTVMKGDLVEVDPTFQRQGGWVFVIDEVGFGAVREEDLEYLN